MDIETRLTLILRLKLQRTQRKEVPTIFQNAS